MSDIVFLNGLFLPEQDAKVSIFDRGFLFADGVYEVLPVINRQLIDEAPFYQRLLNNLQALQLEWPQAEMLELGDDIQSQIKVIFTKLIEKNQIDEGGIYLQLTRGVAARDFAYPKNITPTVMAFAFKKQLLKNPLAKTGVKIITTDDIRWQRRDIKTISLLGQCMAKQEAVEAGVFEAWMLEDGYVTEGTSSSAYIVKNNCIITRPLSNAILPGIRRKILLQLAKQNKIKLEQRAFTLDEALDANEAFMSSATTMILPITHINGQKIADGKPGRLFKLLRRMYIEQATAKS